jgi:hypothetical protein
MLSHSLCTHAVMLTVFNLASTSPRFHHRFCLLARPHPSTSWSGTSLSISSSYPRASCSFFFRFTFPQLLTPAGLLTNIAGDEDEPEGFEDGKGANARFNCPVGITEGFADGQGEAARFNWPTGVALAANDEIVVTDTENHAIWVVTPGCKKGGAVTSDSPCSCTAESRDCRARSSLLFLSCRKWLYALPIIVQLLSSSVHVVLGE